jgi:hypothetical protein
MIPASISATALQVAQACPARFHAENVLKSKGMGTAAASTGTAVHGALEMFVQKCYIEKTEEPSLKLIKEFYALSYAQTFGSFDNSTVEFADGFDLVTKWFKRTDLSEIHRIISVETKKNFPVPTSVGPIPFNYVWDRFDEVRPGVFKVVDYKTNRWNVSRDQLKKKIQARAYGLACAIELKAAGIEYEKIWVEFDMLRHEPVGLVFTHEDNKAFWQFLLDTMEWIISIPDTDDQGNPIPIPERLNPECLFCVRKASCGALKKNLIVGGINSLSFEEAIDLRAQVNAQMSGLNSLANDLDNKINAHAKALDLEGAETQDNLLTFTISSRRQVDGDRAELILGPRLFEKYGAKTMTIKQFDALMKSNEITADQKAQLRSIVYTAKGDPKPKIEPKNPIDDD